MPKFRNPQVKKKLLWEEISQAMNIRGYSVAVDAADRKIRNMKATYRTIVDNNNKKKSTGKGRISWEYFSIFQDILREDKTVNPCPLMSSTASETNSVNTNNTKPTRVNNNTPLNEPSIDVEPEVQTLCNSGSVTPTSSVSSVGSQKCNKPQKATQLDMLRKRQLQIEEDKLSELKKLRESVEENNKLQREKLEILKLMIAQSNT
ncbi:hypothetical protein RI129_002559 [Pyrocoelia pectoralis]|uniref:Myb/SANT-like DNA-binding domain-containing protein n=1 Tax=Pyrocoelia pectoralis TaxID=417401 RepID=A0AAN7VGS2_9COLE